MLHHASNRANLRCSAAGLQRRFASDLDERRCPGPMCFARPRILHSVKKARRSQQARLPISLDCHADEGAGPRGASSVGKFPNLRRNSLRSGATRETNRLSDGPIHRYGLGAGVRRVRCRNAGGTQRHDDKQQNAQRSGKEAKPSQAVHAISMRHRHGERLAHHAPIGKRPRNGQSSLASGELAAVANWRSPPGALRCRVLRNW